ncbi:MAG: LysR family transcriptional regulator [Sphingomonadales bacterium]|nr:LysR family transcriptional regulator [Sphingomonadales bacterium]
MPFQHLRTFIEVYRERSISAAARKLGLTQPAVSQHIAALEATIERDLFKRHSRGVIPTPTADELAASLGDSLDVAEAALFSARARSPDMSGAVRLIGNGDFLAEVVVPRLLPLLRTGLRVHIEAGAREEIRAALHEDQHDLAIGGEPIEDRRLRSIRIHEEVLFAVASPPVSARILAADALAAGLAGEPILAYNLEQPLLDSWLAANAITLRLPSPALTGQDLRFLRSLLRQGFGWTVLPGYLCDEQIRRGELAEIRAPIGNPRQGYYLSWAPAALRHPRVSAVQRALSTAFDADQIGTV